MQAVFKEIMCYGGRVKQANPYQNPKYRIKIKNNGRNFKFTAP